MIDELVPSGVAFRALGDIAITVAGLSGKSKSDFSEGSARYVSYKNAFANLSVDQFAEDFVKVRDGEKQNRLQRGDVIITGSSESLDEVGMSSVVATEPVGPLYLNSFCFAVRFADPSLLLPEFSKYLFRSDAVRTQIRRTASGVTRINVSKPRFMKVRVPLPPLEVQLEIARVLDEFTQREVKLEAELAAELNARHRQYDYYRNQLLTADIASARIARIDELFDLRAGKFIAASAIVASPDDEHPIPCFGGGGLRGYVATPNQSGDRVLIGRQGALCGNVKRTSGEFYATEHSVVVTPKPGVDVSWAFHTLMSMNLNQYASRSAQPGLAVATLNQLQTAAPPLNEQVRVGKILDRLDSLVNDLSIRLPAEAIARRKQYEYYRDKLLTFKEAMT
ncbi:restriction endonuclease subunit S [Leifsonia shinshuensis]|uniref:restriction endonuclease subunit S n=1 Tax=Leifsonia shinshuensis TaxID=150026 RepID=UPI0028664B97|nr:restriction endonuclease subunit S [Leifsonia shinshuensis]MDR6971261.1 type I restriction enzyme S subunit [Leifsonia shinshuensis]